MPTQEPPPSRPAKRRLGVWLLPLAILLGFALLFALLFRDRLLPTKPVAVVPAIGIEETMTVEPDTRVSSGKAQFQASGWVEPDP
jgi:hypothetical protein